MKGLLVLFSGLLSMQLAAENSVKGIDAVEGETANQTLAASARATRSKTNQKDVVVFVGDRVIPQLVDGAGWKTTITLINLESRTVTFKVLFFRDNGTDLYVPVLGQGSVRGMDIALGSAASVTLETGGTGSQLAQGWALLSQSSNDSIGGMAIFRQQIPGRQDQEAVVPIVNQFSSHFVMPFDNAGFLTGTAIANPTDRTVVVPITIRNEQGAILDRRTETLGPFSHVAFATDTSWPATAGRRGTIEFLTTGFGVGALGLRFNGNAFTSFHVLENFNWAVR